MSENDTLSQEDFNNKIENIKNEGNKELALEKRNELAARISQLQQEGMRSQDLQKIRSAMGFATILNRDIPKSSLEQQEDERDDDNAESVSHDRCFIVDDVEEGTVSSFLENENDGIVLQFSGSDIKTCISRSNFRPSIIRQALLKTCIFNQDGEITDYSPENYVNMRKLGLFTDAIIDLREVLGYFLGNISVNQFELTRASDEIKLTSSYGLATQGKSMSNEAARAASTVNTRMEYGIYSPQPVGNTPIIKAWLDRRVVPPNIVELSEATSAVSAAHCQAGQEKTIWKINEIDGFDYTEKYNEIIQSEEWKELFTYPYDEDILAALSGPLEALGAHFVKAAMEIQNAELDDTRTDIGDDYDDYDEDEQEEEDMKALINCALAKWFENDGAFEQYTAERFDNTILSDLQNYELKLQAIFGKNGIEEHFRGFFGDIASGFAEDKITSEKLRQNTIHYINREDNSQPDSVKRMELDWIISAPDSVYETIIRDLEEEVRAKIAEKMNEGLMATKVEFDRLMQSMIDRYCSPEDIEGIAGRLFYDSQEVSIESIINCAFGEYYRTGGTFDQISQEENDGNAVSEDELNKRKIENIYSRKWVNVVLFEGDDECHEDDKQAMYEYVDDERERILVRGCDYITPNGLKDIAKDYVEKRFREGKISEEERQQLKDSIGSFDYENTKRELNNLKTELYYRIKQALDETQRPAEDFMEENAQDRTQHFPTPELITICRDVISSFSNELIRNNCDSDQENLRVARRLDLRNVSSAETESVDEDDKYEKLVYCAFGKWYGEDGKFEQLSKEQASGDGDPEPTINEITNQKMKDILSDQWKTVLLDRSRESYHHLGGWDSEGMTTIFESLEVDMDDPNKKPLDEAKLISITKSYIEEDDLWSTAQAKNEEIQKLESWASEGNPIKDLLNNIQATLYDKINRIAAEAARRAAGDDIDENDDNVGYWDDHNSQLLDICTIEIDDYTAELVRYNCLGGLTQERPDTQNYDPSFQPDEGQGFYDMVPDDISEIGDGGPMSLSELNEENEGANEGGKKKKKRRKSKKGKKTKKKKAKKNKKKKKTKRRVKFNLKNNEYYTITPKNKIRKNKKRGTRKKKN